MPRWACERRGQLRHDRGEGATYSAEIDDGTSVSVEGLDERMIASGKQRCSLVGRHDGSSDGRFEHFGDLEHLSWIREVGGIINNSFGTVLVDDWVERESATSESRDRAATHFEREREGE